TVSYSKTILLNSTKAPDLNIYPNPAKNQLYISLINPVFPKMFQLSLYNQKGEYLLNCLYKTNTPLDISYLPKGIYLIQLSGDNIKVSKYFFKG
ncbi:MAG: T9SS type A sorting domain-containing protein, partial [Flavobacterium sp.]